MGLHPQQAPEPAPCHPDAPHQPPNWCHQSPPCTPSLISCGHWWLPSSTMMARRPSGDSPTHLTLYRVARGRVLDLLLRDREQSRAAGHVSSEREARTTRPPAPKIRPSCPLGQSSLLILAPC